MALNCLCIPGEGARLFSACEAMCQVMGELGVAVDGGKDSLSMAAAVGEVGLTVTGISLLIVQVDMLTFITESILYLLCSWNYAVAAVWCRGYASANQKV